MNLSHTERSTVSIVPLPAAPGAGPQDSFASRHAELLARRRFGSLDALRAISILGVIWHHAAAGSHAWRLLDRGAHGVTLFFAISGFLITTLLLQERERFGTVSLGRFYARRTLRIFPLYFAVLGLFCAAALWRGMESDFARRFFHQLPSYLTYTSNWGSSRSEPFGYSWSLACEEQFYLLWPPTLVLLGARRAVWPLLALLAARQCGAIGWLDAVLPRDHAASRILATVQPAILLGVLLALFLRSPTGHRVLHAILGSRFASLVVLCAVAGVLSLPPLDGRSAIVIDLAMTLLVAAVVIPPDHVLGRPSRSWPLVRIGVVSYGMYLFHGPILSALKPLRLQPASAFLAALVLTWGAAELSFATFEKPFRNAKTRYERRPPDVVFGAPASRVPLGASPRG